MAKRVRNNSHIAKLFLSLTGSRNLWQAWSDVIFFIAVSLSNPFDNGERKLNREKTYTEKMKNYSDQEQKIIVSIYAAIIDALEQNPNQDLLGQLFMELNLGNERNGQFFTPYNVCELMANISYGDEIKSKLAYKVYVVVNDCACGGGATLIAFANKIHETGVNYQTDCMFVAQDIDYTTALMCYVQLSLLGCPGYIKIGDTLTDPLTDSWMEVELGNSIWLTPMFYTDIWLNRRVMEQWKRIFHGFSVSSAPKETTLVAEEVQEPSVTEIVIPMVEQEAVQLSLF